MTEEYKKKRLKSLALIFQVAGISLIVMNATLFAETVYRIMDCGIGLFEGTLLVTAVLNILELINNWTSINKFIYHYGSIPDSV